MNARGPAGTAWASLERVLIPLVVLHSLAIGVLAMVATRWGLAFSGFGAATPMFFPRQVGVFHVVVAVAYAIEWRRYGGVSILLTAKAIAVLFLGAQMLLQRLPWVVPFSLAGDAAMWLAVAVVHRRARAS